jgi:hypothetical protein
MTLGTRSNSLLLLLLLLLVVVVFVVVGVGMLLMLMVDVLLSVEALLLLLLLRLPPTSSRKKSTALRPSMRARSSSLRKPAVDLACTRVQINHHHAHHTTSATGSQHHARNTTKPQTEPIGSNSGWPQSTTTVTPRQTAYTDGQFYNGLGTWTPPHGTRTAVHKNETNAQREGAETNKTAHSRIHPANQPRT